MGARENLMHKNSQARKEEDHDQQWMMIMDGDEDNHHETSNIPSSSSSCEESFSNESSLNSYSSSLVEDLDDASSSSSSSNFNSINENGPLYELTELTAHLPIKRGLSKFYQGKSQSFTSLTRVTSLEDLAKKETPLRRSRTKIKPCKSYGACLCTKAAISKKVSKNSLPPSLSFQTTRSRFLLSSRLPSISVQKPF